MHVTRTLKNLLRPFYRRAFRRGAMRGRRACRGEFRDVGFHGDTHLLALVDVLMPRCDCFVETGTNMGSTLVYTARRYPHMRCFSCEPDPGAFRQAMQNAAGLDNVRLYNLTSQQFLARLRQEHPDVLESEALFWLDAHGYGFQWPLKDELAFITSHCGAAYVLMDDFKVPGMDCFGYSRYDGQECSWDYVKDALDSGRRYRLFYPSYSSKTSEHHPLRGWCLMEFGHDAEIELPEGLRDKVWRVDAGRTERAQGTDTEGTAEC